MVTAYNAAVAVRCTGAAFSGAATQPTRLLVRRDRDLPSPRRSCARPHGASTRLSRRARCRERCGAVLVGALPLLRLQAAWTLRGARFGAALGPAARRHRGAVFDWRAIFAVQAPIAAAGWSRRGTKLDELGSSDQVRKSLPANVCLALVFGALVGVLFLAVLFVIEVWGYTPLGGAAIVGALQRAATARCDRSGSRRRAVICGGAALSRSGSWRSRCFPRRRWRTSCSRSRFAAPASGWSFLRSPRPRRATARSRSACGTSDWCWRSQSSHPSWPTTSRRPASARRCARRRCCSTHPFRSARGARRACRGEGVRPRAGG